jgi:hypothetical protein
LLTLLLSILPVDWPRKERGKAYRLAVGNLVLLRHDRPEQAWHWMERVLRTPSRSTEEYFLGAVCLYPGLGRMQEATALFARADDRDFALAQALGVTRSPYCVLDEIWARHIGDATILDYVIELSTGIRFSTDTSRFCARDRNEGAIRLGRNQHSERFWRLRGKARRR